MLKHIIIKLLKLKTKDMSWKQPERDVALIVMEHQLEWG